MAKKKKFEVLLLHGHGHEWQSVETFIQHAGYSVRVVEKEPGGGALFEKFRNIVWDTAHCAVIVMTKDDKMSERRKTFHYARQNVVFELGYCFGAFDSVDEKACYRAEDAVIVVEEAGVQRFANIEGLVTIRFDSGKIDEARPAIERALEHAYERGSKFYNL